MLTARFDRYTPEAWPITSGSLLFCKGENEMERERVRKRCKQEHRGRQAVPMVGEYALRNAPANISECKVSLAARWSGPALSPYHERSPNSEAEFSRFFLAEGGSGMERCARATGTSAQMESWLFDACVPRSDSQARHESFLRHNRACQIPPFIIKHLIQLLHDLTLNFYS